MTTPPLRIAFDVDGVLADMESALTRQAAILFGDHMLRQLDTPVVDAPPTDVGDKPDGSQQEGIAANAASMDESLPLPKLRMTTRQQRRLWRHVGQIDNFWGTLDECEPGIVARLAAIAAERRWEVIFLTKRPPSAGATAQVQTQRWLQSKGFALPSVFVVQRSRGRIASALGLDIVVDDRPDNCLDVVVDSKARAILVWRGDPARLPPAAARLGMGTVTTVAECLDMLTAGGDTSDTRVGLLARMKRLFGFRETVSSSRSPEDAVVR